MTVDAMMFNSLIEDNKGGRMTKAEAVKALEFLIEDNEEHIYDHFGTETEWALKMAIAALAPTPDPDTGLMPCGCGGKARIEESPFADDADNIGLKIYMVGCTDCTIGFEGYFTSSEDAQERWNTAMGSKEADNG